MSHRITSSVGQGGKNQAADVKIVQQLLNGFASHLKLSPLSVSGKAEPKTIKFIFEFQKRVVGLSKADGLIVPGGRTWKKLSGGPSGASGGGVSGGAKAAPTSGSSKPAGTSGSSTGASGGGASGGAKTSPPKTASIGGKAASVPPKGIQVLKEILQEAGLNKAIVTRVTSTPKDQARIMFENITKKGVKSQMGLYLGPGKKVIQVYVDNQGKSDTEIKDLMLAEIIKLGPETVSHHCSTKLIVFDVAPSSISNKGKFEAAANKAKSAGKILKFLGPGKGDPGYHFEIAK
jgi:hypothetical protein